MANILMTGFTALQVSADRRAAISKIDGPAAVVRALRELGHTVDWRRVALGDDLSSYDAAWVNLAPINSLNGRKGALGAVYTMGRLPFVGFFDDWQFEAVWRGMTAMVRHRPKTLHKTLLDCANRMGEDATYWSHAEAQAAADRINAKGGKASPAPFYYTENDETVTRFENELYTTMERFLAADLPMAPAVPAYRWGDRSLVRTRMDRQSKKPIAAIDALDLSPIIYDDILNQVVASPMSDKKEEFLLAALMPHADWLDKKQIAWPVHMTGSQKMVRERGAERLKTEVDVLRRYNDYQAALSPSYPHAGSGWWRSRFLYCARVGSILVCDRGEADALGAAYAVTPAAVERMSVEERASTALAQREALRPWMTSWDQFVAHCGSIIERTMK